MLCEGCNDAITDSEEYFSMVLSKGMKLPTRWKLCGECADEVRDFLKTSYDRKKSNGNNRNDKIINSLKKFGDKL